MLRAIGDLALIVGIIALCIAFGGIYLTSACHAEPIIAHTANQFLNSIGINPGGRDRNVSDAHLYSFAGIRAARNSFVNSPSAYLNFWNATKAPGFPGTKADIEWEGQDVPTMMALGRAICPSKDNCAISSFEGANEPGNFGVTYKGVTCGGSGNHDWLCVAQGQADLYAAVKGDSVLGFLPVYGVSVDGAQYQNYGLQFLTIPAGAGTLMPDWTSYADFATLHNYVVGNGSCGTIGPNQAYLASSPTLQSCWDDLAGELSTTWLGHFPGYAPDRLFGIPRVTTETGCMSTSNCVNEDTQGKIVLNTYLSQWLNGWTQTYWYNLSDAGWGLFNPAPALTPKPAAVYLHNLTTILADMTDGPTDRLGFSVTPYIATVHSFLLRKSNGHFFVVVWDELLPGAGQDQVYVQFATPESTVNVYDVVAGTLANPVYSNTDSVPLLLTDHPIILEVF
jgi:hypothetical protein